MTTRILHQHVNPLLMVLGLSEFLLCTVSVYVGVALLHGMGSAGMGPFITALAPKALTFGAVVTLSLASMGLYQARQRLRFEGIAVRVLVALGGAGAALAVIYLVVPALSTGGAAWAASVGVSALGLIVTRGVASKLLEDERFRRQVLVYGAGKRASTLLQLRRRSDQRGFRIRAFVPAESDECRVNDPRVRELGGCSLFHVADELGVQEVVVAMDDRRKGFPVADLLACKFSGMSVVDIVSFLERETGRVKIELVHPSWMIFSQGFTRRSGRLSAQRLMDVVAALLVLAVAWPFMILVALAILIDDGGPVLYRQRRVGYRGQVFWLLKFRSMSVNAEAGGEAQWAQKNDSRVTRVGRVTRKFRLDELPQLINVLRGEMSFVGPRPERPEFVAQLAEKIPFYHERHSVKPGLTGWAQLCYPYGSSDRDAMEKLQYDMYYVKNQSLIFDLMILLQTAEVVLWQKGSR